MLQRYAGPNRPAPEGRSDDVREPAVRKTVVHRQYTDDLGPACSGTSTSDWTMKPVCTLTGPPSKDGWCSNACPVRNTSPTSVSVTRRRCRLAWRDWDSCWRARPAHPSQVLPGKCWPLRRRSRRRRLQPRSEDCVQILQAGDGSADLAQLANFLVRRRSCSLMDSTRLARI